MPGYTLFLQASDDESKSLPIVVGQYEAQSIALAMEEITLNRPMTHDLLDTVIQVFSEGLVQVSIADLQEGTYYARLHVETGDKVEQVDARPSDAIALALRRGVPIMVEDRLFERSAVATPGVEEKSNKHGSTFHENVHAITEQAEKRFDLEKDLRDAVLEEDYEKAARIRDKLEAISKTHD